MLQLAPKDFWSMTAFEFSAALGDQQQDMPPLTRAEMQKLMKNHPDQNHPDH